MASLVHFGMEFTGLVGQKTFCRCQKASCIESIPFFHSFFFSFLARNTPSFSLGLKGSRVESEGCRFAAHRMVALGFTTSAN